VELNDDFENHRNVKSHGEHGGSGGVTFKSHKKHLENKMGAGSGSKSMKASHMASMGLSNPQEKQVLKQTDKLNHDTSQSILISTPGQQQNQHSQQQ